MNLQVENSLKQYLSAALGPIVFTKSCLYTLTPDRDFVISPLPSQENVLLAVGAGHAVKFALLLGRILS